LVEAKNADSLGQLLCLILKRVRGRSSFLDQRCVLLGYLVHLRNRLVHLLDTGALLQAYRCDLDADHADAGRALRIQTPRRTVGAGRASNGLTFGEIVRYSTVPVEAGQVVRGTLT
jgi:hypothetical protein